MRRPRVGGEAVTRLLSATVVLVGVTLSAACGGQADASRSSTGVGQASGPAEFPVTVSSVTVSQRPSRVVSLSPTATEMLFGIGAGRQVVAVDDQSNYPADAPRTDLSGFKPNVEAIAAQRPDLVVVSSDPDQIVERLQKLKIPTYLAPAATTLLDTYQQLADLGRLTGNAASATALADTMRKQIAELTESAVADGPALTYYHELDQTYYSATSKTFIGSLYQSLGLTNIADAADHAASGYPQLSAEYVVRSNPDLIFLADAGCCQQSVSSVGGRPGFAELTAVRTGQVVALDDDIASRWGPRVVELMRAIVVAVRRARSQ